MVYSLSEKLGLELNLLALVPSLNVVSFVPIWRERQNFLMGLIFISYATCVCVCMHACICMCVYVWCMCVYVCGVCVCMCVVYVCVCVWCVCVCVCVCARVHVLNLLCSDRSAVLPSSVINLKELTSPIINVKDYQFLHGYHNPTVLFLCEHQPTWAGWVHYITGIFTMLYWCIYSIIGVFTT